MCLGASPAPAHPVLRWAAQHLQDARRAEAVGMCSGQDGAAQGRRVGPALDCPSDGSVGVQRALRAGGPEVSLGRVGEGGRRRKGRQEVVGRGAAWGGDSLYGERPLGGLHAATSGSGGLEPEPEPPGHAGSAPWLPATLSARPTLPSPGPDAGGGPGGTAACPRGPEPQTRDPARWRVWAPGCAGRSSRNSSQGVCPSICPSVHAA